MEGATGGIVAVISGIVMTYIIAAQSMTNQMIETTNKMADYYTSVVEQSMQDLPVEGMVYDFDKVYIR